MVDRTARDEFAKLLWGLASGRLTNFQYEDAAAAVLRNADRRDRAIRVIFSAAWFLYDDIREHRMSDRHALSELGRRAVSRWMVFLYSDLEYEWPIKSMISLSGCLLQVLTLGIARRILGPRKERKMRSLGAWDQWPFMRKMDYDLANATVWRIGSVGEASSSACSPA